jgi:hypothetical protein
MSEVNGRRNGELERALALYMDMRRLQKQTEQAASLAGLLGDKTSLYWSIEISDQQERHRVFIENLHR